MLGSTDAEQSADLSKLRREAAAYEGIASNPGYPITDRLGCAIKALALWEEHRDLLRTAIVQDQPMHVLMEILGE
jgi:hypothetical protein